MQVTVGTKATTPMPDGRRHPAIAVSEPTSEKVVIINRQTGQPVEITVSRADFISLREARDGSKYLALTTEVVQYGYRPIAEPRFSAVVGLDASEDGEVLSLDALMEAHGASFSEWQAKNFEARRGIVLATDA